MTVEGAGTGDKKMHYLEAFGREPRHYMGQHMIQCFRYICIAALPYSVQSRLFLVLLSCRGCPLKLSYHGYSTITVLTWLPYQSCPVTGFHGCPVNAGLL